LQPRLASLVRRLSEHKDDPVYLDFPTDIIIDHRADQSQSPNEIINKYDPTQITLTRQVLFLQNKVQPIELADRPYAFVLGNNREVVFLSSNAWAKIPANREKLVSLVIKNILRHREMNFGSCPSKIGCTMIHNSHKRYFTHQDYEPSVYDYSTAQTLPISVESESVTRYLEGAGMLAMQLLQTGGIQSCMNIRWESYHTGNASRDPTVKQCLYLIAVHEGMYLIVF
jgi:hypothetical protein